MLSYRAHERVQRVALWIFVGQLGLLVGIEAVIIAVFGGDWSFNEAYKYPTLQTVGIATSLYPVFAAVGALFVLYLTHVMKNILLMGLCLGLWIAGYFLGALVIGDMRALMASRVIKGLAIGMLTSVLPLYIEKVARSPKQAAQLLTLLQAAIPCGILLMALVGKLAIELSYFQRWMYAALPTFPVVLLVFNIPREVSIIDQKKQEESSQVRSAFQSLKLELRKLRRAPQNDAWIRCTAACLAQVAGPTTAINVIFYYSSTMCKMLGFETQEADFMAIGLYACNALGTSLSLMFINKLPRVSTLKYSILGMAVIHIGLFLVQLTGGYLPNCGSLGLVAITLMFAFVFVYSLLFAGIQLVYTSEVVSPETRAVSIGIATASGWLWNFVIAFVSAYILPIMGSYIFLLFADLCCIVFILFAFMPL